MVATNGITSATKPDGKRRHRGFSVSSTSSVFQESADQRYRVTESYPQGGTGIPAGEINYIYYDSQWQAIETRTNGTAASNVSSQMVWSAAYINAAILQDSYTAGTLQPNSRLYFLQDANWNTTAIVNFINAAWQVLQYYVYSPYGTITVLNEDGAGSTPIVNNLYQGMTLDQVTGLYYARNRNYSPTLGRWINQDPAGYVNGANTYQFVMSNPVGNTDPRGTTNDEPWWQPMVEGFAANPYGYDIMQWSPGGPIPLSWGPGPFPVTGNEVIIRQGVYRAPLYPSPPVPCQTRDGIGNTGSGGGGGGGGGGPQYLTPGIGFQLIPFPR